jgi:hypothetical protein
VAFLDWDLAAPPVRDLAHAAWQFVPLSDDRGCASNGWTRPPDRPHRLRILCDGYGLPRADRTGFSGAVAERVDATASGIERLAAEGVAAHERLIQEGVPALVRVDKAWVERHTSVLDTALVSQLSALGDGEAKAQRYEDATREPAQDAGEGRTVPESPSQGARSERTALKTTSPIRVKAKPKPSICNPATGRRISAARQEEQSGLRVGRIREYALPEDDPEPRPPGALGSGAASLLQDGSDAQVK